MLIKGEFLRRTIQVRGCCQEKELLKLYAYTLVEHPIVVHLDIDSLILRPLDVIYDAMIDGIGAVDPSDLSAAGGTPLPTGRIDTYFTRDFNLIVNPGRSAGVQRGFLAVRMDLAVYKEYLRIILESDH